VTVTVTNVGSQSGSMANGFTYNALVAISYAQVASATPQSSTATVSVSYPAAQTAGDLNIVVVGWNDTAATVQSGQRPGRGLRNPSTTRRTSQAPPIRSR
jgi:hypothetical protein